MQKILRDKCPVCGSEAISPFKKGNITEKELTPEDFKITDSRYGTLWNFNKCSDCGFLFSNPFLSQEDLITLYSMLEDSEYMQESEGREKNFASILKTLKKIAPENKNLLDIGAASGIFMHLAQKEGYRVSGIEPSEFLVKQAESEFGLKIFKGTAEDFKTEEKFSLITLLDIVEHLADPAEFMRSISPLCEKGGTLVIVTPDPESFAAKIAGSKWWHYRVAHVNFFSIKSLVKLLESSGFTVIKKRRYAWHFSLFYLVTRIIPSVSKSTALQKILKKINLKLQLFDSWEVYAKKN